MQVGYNLAGSTSGGTSCGFSGYRGLLNQLPAKDLESFGQAHRTEVERFSTDQGIWLNVEALISMGRKPQPRRGGFSYPTVARLSYTQTA